MLAVRCSRCGAPTPIALASDTYQCAHCGAAAAHTPQALHQIAAARALLFGVGARSRQLSGAQSAALRWSSAMIGLYFAVMLAFLAVFAGCAACVGASVGDDGPPEALWWIGGLAVLPIVIFVAGGLIGLPAQLSARKKLERSCAASPPARPGEPARCHVCGGPVAAQGARAVARCSYCAADNIMTPRAVALAANRAVLDISDYENAVRQATRSAAVASILALLALPLTALVTPVVAIVVWGVLVWVAANIEGPVDKKLQFVEVDLPKGRCLAQFFPEKPVGQRVNVGSSYGDSVPQNLDRPGLKPFDGTALVGRRVTMVTDGRYPDAVIVRTWTTPLFPGSVYARLKNKNGDEGSVEVMNGICFK